MSRSAATRIDGGRPARVRGIGLLLSDDDALWSVRYPTLDGKDVDTRAPDVSAQLCQVDAESARATRCTDTVVSIGTGGQVAAGDGALWLGIGTKLTRIAAR